MALKLGLDCKVYRNTGSYASPTWNEISIVKDASLTLERAEADVSTRGSGGWRATVGTLKDGTLEFSAHCDRSITADKADLDAIRDAFINGTSIELLVIDGTQPQATLAAEGLRSSFMITAFNITQNLEEGVQYDVTGRTVPTDNSGTAVAPAWFTGTTS